MKILLVVVTVIICLLLVGFCLFTLACMLALDYSLKKLDKPFRDWQREQRKVK